MPNFTKCLRDRVFAILRTGLYRARTPETRQTPQSCVSGARARKLTSRPWSNARCRRGRCSTWNLRRKGESNVNNRDLEKLSSEKNITSAQTSTRRRMDAREMRARTVVVSIVERPVRVRVFVLTARCSSSSRRGCCTSCPAGEKARSDLKSDVERGNLARPRDSRA